jgi:hypothetical protein
VPPDEARRVANEILSGAEYRRPEPSPVDRAWQWLLDSLSDLLAGVGGGSGGFWFGIALLVGAVGLTTWILWRVLPRRRPPAPPAGAEVAVRADRRPTRGELLARAVEAEAHRRWGEAVVLRYRALVAGLAERHQLPDDPAATTGELRRRFEAGEEQRAAFERASTRFEEVRYGGSTATADDPRRLAAWDRELLGGRR